MRAEQPGITKVACVRIRECGVVCMVSTKPEEAKTGETGEERHGQQSKMKSQQVVSAPKCQRYLRNGTGTRLHSATGNGSCGLSKNDVQPRMCSVRRSFLFL